MRTRSEGRRACRVTGLILTHGYRILALPQSPIVYLSSQQETCQEVTMKFEGQQRIHF
jgi:hypothetical protein